MPNDHKIKKNNDVTETLNNSYYYFNLFTCKVGILLISHRLNSGKIMVIPG